MTKETRLDEVARKCVGCGKDARAPDRFMSYGQGPFCSAEHRDLFATNRPKCPSVLPGGEGCLKNPNHKGPPSNDGRDVFTCPDGHVFKWPPDEPTDTADEILGKEK